MKFIIEWDIIPYKNIYEKKVETIMGKQFEEAIKMNGTWLPVDADNVIDFNGVKLLIPFKNKDYKVKESYIKGWQYENEALMDKAFVVVKNEDNKILIEVYNENLEMIGGVKNIG